MGFVSFPGTETELAKSGPGVAQHLAHVYKEYLAGFDTVYITSVIESKRRLQASAAMQSQPAGGSGVQPGPGPQAPTNLPPNARSINAAQMQSVMAYAHQSVTQLRQQGVPEKMILFVEQNRVYLQRIYQEQQMFQGKIPRRPPGMGQGPSDQPGPMSGNNGQVPFPTSSGQPDGPHPAGLRPPFSQQNGNSMPGNNFMENRPQPQMPNGGLPMGRPSREQMQHAAQFVMKVKQEFIHNSTSITLNHFK